MSFETRRIFVIGGTGAQGMSVVRGLVGDGKYQVLALTRDATSDRARQLQEMPNVSILEGSFADEDVIRNGFRACDGAFVNIDGFNTGEKTETFLAMRAYEIAMEEGTKFFVFGNLDYVLKKSGYDSRFRTGHYDGKGRVAEWILSQNKANADKMGAAIFTTGPYMEMAFSPFTPMTPKIEEGIVTWRVPLGHGAVVHVSLEDCAYYVRWLFDNTERSVGMDLEVAIEHVRYDELAAAFERVTGHPARYIDTDVHQYFGGPLKNAADRPAGYNADPADRSTMSFRDNFTGFWNMWKHDVIKRDYQLLDDIHPNRLKSAEQWIRRHEDLARLNGSPSLWDKLQPEALQNSFSVLKSSEDRQRGNVGGL
ncbi:NmrA family NAD(P)-binding protein [Rhizobium leguminosarum]|uniref:NmrA family NAD(P)-binding protein n=1 Tax=Rhizobium leguminosarum TaxID=384 RepID=UPI0024B3B627|nr:NmrA family NAD(P)-binding protein [Rhizobium leguminosarum]WHO84119.1 NmrA family NAD(P)-binding protein [Rhizobium leguminosarum]